jgi:hypothetical protein
VAGLGNICHCPDIDSHRHIRDVSDGGFESESPPAWPDDDRRILGSYGDFCHMVEKEGAHVDDGVIGVVGVAGVSGIDAG